MGLFYQLVESQDGQNGLLPGLGVLGDEISASGALHNAGGMDPAHCPGGPGKSDDVSWKIPPLTCAEVLFAKTRKTIRSFQKFPQVSFPQLTVIGRRPVHMKIQNS